MGRIGMLSRAMRAESAKKPATRLSKEIQKFYATHPISPWQKDRCNDIRVMYQEKQQGLDVAHNIASSKLAEEYMGFELEYLQTSHRLKGEVDGHQPFHKDLRALLSFAFWQHVGRSFSGWCEHMMTTYGKKA